MSIQYCIEDQDTLLLFREFFPEKAAFSFWEWLSQFGKLESHSPEERLEMATTLASELPAVEWLSTVENLRQALILTPEHVEHCFSELKPSAKNQALRECFHFYLRTPLAKDRVAFFWQWWHQVKTESVSLSDVEEVVFLPASPASYLFQEMLGGIHYFKNFATQVLPFHEIVSGESTSPRSYWGRVSSNALTLAKAVADSAKATPDQRIYISLATEPAVASFLRLKLTELGLPFALEREKPETEKPFSFWEHWLQALRVYPGLALVDRLKLCSRLQKKSPFQKETEEGYLARLVKRQAITEAESQVLAQLTQVAVPPALPTSPSTQVHFIPLMALPAVSHVKHFVLVDKALHEKPLSPLLISEGEKEKLFRAGFSLPRWAEVLKARETTLRILAAQPQAEVFVSEIELEQMEKIPVATPTPEAPCEVSFQVPFQIRSLSATQLETYAQCPAKYLYTRLRLDQAPSPQEKFALHLGQVVHHALEHYFKENPKGSPTSETLEAYFKKAMEANLPTLRESDADYLLFSESFRKFIPRIIHCEASLAAMFGPHTPTQFEQGFSFEIGKSTFTGKIDRIDTLENGDSVVLDYKTGTITFTPDHIAQGISFQALLYWLATEKETGKPPAAMLFYDLKKGELRRGIAREEAISKEAKKQLTRGHTLAQEKLDALVEAGQSQIYTLAERISSGAFAPTPDASACRYCDASSFCRKGTEYV